MSLGLNQASVDDTMDIDSGTVNYPSLPPPSKDEHLESVEDNDNTSPDAKLPDASPLDENQKKNRRAVRKILDSAPNDLYGIANSSKSDTAKTIRKNLKEISLRVHPDKLPQRYHKQANQAQARVNGAREVLLDETKRARFDTEGFYEPPQPQEDKTNPDFHPNAWEDDLDLDSDSDDDSEDDSEDDDTSQRRPDEYIKKVYAQATPWVQEVLKNGGTFDRNQSGKKNIKWTESREFNDIKTKQEELNQKIMVYNESKKVKKTQHTFDITTAHLFNSMQANPYIEKWKKDHFDRNALEWIVYFSRNIHRLNKEKGYPLEWNFKSFEDQDPSDKSRDTQDQPEKEGGLSDAEDDASTNGSSASQDSQSQEIKPLKPGFTPDGEKIVGKLPKIVYSGYSDLSIITECKFFVEVHLSNRKNKSISDIELRTEADIGFEAAQSYLNDIPEEEQAELIDIPKKQKGQYKRQFQGITGATAQEFKTRSNKKLPPTYIRGKFKDGAVIKEHFMTRTTLRTILGQKTADQLIQQHYNQYDVAVKEPPWPKFMDWQPARKAIRSGRSRREQEQSESESESEDNYTPINKRGRGRAPRSESESEENYTPINKRGRGRAPRSELQQNSQQNTGETNLSLEETVSKEVAKAMAQMMVQIQQEMKNMSVGNQT
ncbi:hypothetical protein BofuT4_P074340.1 [Botrytis cinerea T4]|uniref:J domain-containing protein n=1 Tax=Botryotinia fuckeliana (strain T4) TaxID=999810 RepID=G2XP26_BOTF4|nr:hypothetical protein BofuT4_P074340.1 [Botrytis cinerea T4]